MFDDLCISIQTRKRDAFDVHLQFSSKIESIYKTRNTDPSALEKTIDYCLAQISIAEDAKEAWLNECFLIGGELLLPSHKGYEQLCIIYEKQKKFSDVIKLATQAKMQGWNGNWDKRIKRCGEQILRLKRDPSFSGN